MGGLVMRCEDCYREEYLGEHDVNRIEEEDNEY